MQRIEPILGINRYIIANIKRSFKLFYQMLFNSRIVINDVIVSMVPQVVTLFVGLVSSVLIARGLGPVEMGKYALVISVSTIAFGLSDLGINRIALRYASVEVSNNNTEGQYAVLRWAFKIRMALILSITTLIFLFAPIISGDIWHSADLTVLIWISLISGIFNAIAAVPTIYFQSLKRFKMNAMVLIGQSIITFIGILSLSLINVWRIESVLLVTMISTGIGALVFLLSVPKESIISFKKGQNHLTIKLKDIFKEPITSTRTLDNINPSTFAIFMALASIISLITSKTDVWLMGVFLDKNEIGIYSVATYFIIPVTTITLALNTVLWPHVSSIKTMDLTIRKLKTTLLISLFVACLFIIYSIVAPLSIPYLFGETYKNSVLIAQILCIANCMLIIYWPMQVFGMNLGYVRHFWWINGIQLIIVITTNIVLLPKIGAIASGIGLFISYLVCLIVTGIFIYNKIYVNGGLENTY